MNDTLIHAVKALDDCRLEDIRAYDVHAATPYFDAVVIATALSSRQLRAAASRLREQADLAHFLVRSVEGEASSEWMLIDLNEVIVHVFTKEGRARYDLDRIYAESPRLDVTDLIAEK